MQFNHDNMRGVWLAEDLVNLLATSTWEKKAVQGLLTHHLFRMPELDTGGARQVQQWTGRLREVFAAASQEDRCEKINALLADGVRRVFLTTHDGTDPHLHFADVSDSVLDRVKAVTAGGLAIFMTEAAGGRLGMCAREGCGRVFADTSRSGRRAYCSARCGNADAVGRYRGRRRRPSQ